ncbi:probable pseudouridine-5'-phosphatase [Sipha flava]|uniref:Probable pseudouridine-5'-phosphatase n=1 Tax=Sipha flava TaxID=143950 RepID=A0A8B8FTZ3_9HEMI|nr:probable pseudouridine-5'-phosphatase [Sipha flava]XP_025413953.1 probable pseudouridine-5'-phosphatase [Sipha flava]
MSKLTPVTHVIFDMDGLLLDTEKVYLSSITKVLKDHGKEYTNDLRIKVMGTIPINTATIIIKELGLDMEPDELNEELYNNQIKHMEQVPFLPGAEKLIDHLHSNNVPIAVATSSGEKSFQVKTANYQHIFSKFHHIVLGSADPEVKQGKPAPDIFLVCASRFDEKPLPEKCLVFEDAPNGVTGAKAAGMQTVMVPDKIIPVEKTSHATQVLSSLLDFKPEDFGLPPFP